MKNLPLNTLRAFAAVYETGGIRPAGRRLGVSHSSISRHLRELEAWIGTPLFVKTVKGGAIVFSPQGETLGREVLSSMAQLDAAVSSIKEAKHPNSVVISTTPSFAVRWLLPRLHLIEAENPRIELSLVVDQQIKSPGDEGADITIRMGQGPWGTQDCQPLMDDKLFPVMSSEHWQRTGRPKSLTDILNLRLLHDRDPNANWDVWKKIHGPPTLDTLKGPRFTSSDLVLRAAEQGLGIALARDCMAQESLETGTLVRPFGDEYVELKQAYWLVLAHNARQRKVVQTVMVWLEEQVELMLQS